MINGVILWTAMSYEWCGILIFGVLFIGVLFIFSVVAFSDCITNKRSNTVEIVRLVGEALGFGVLAVLIMLVVFIGSKLVMDRRLA